MRRNLRAKAAAIPKDDRANRRSPNAENYHSVERDSRGKAPPSSSPVPPRRNEGPKEMRKENGCVIIHKESSQDSSLTIENQSLPDDGLSNAGRESLEAREMARRVLLEQKLDFLSREFERIHQITFEKDRELQVSQESHRNLEAKYRAEVNQYSLLLADRNEKLQEAYTKLTTLESSLPAKGIKEIEDNKTKELEQQRFQLMSHELSQVKTLATMWERKTETLKAENDNLRAKNAELEEQVQALGASEKGLDQKVAEMQRHIELLKQEQAYWKEECMKRGKFEEVATQVEQLKEERENLLRTMEEITKEKFEAEKGRREAIENCEALREDLKRFSGSAKPLNQKSGDDGRNLTIINNMLIEENITLKLANAELRREAQFLRKPSQGILELIDMPLSANFQGETPVRQLQKKIASPSKEDATFYQKIIVELEAKVITLLEQNEKLDILLANQLDH